MGASAGVFNTSTWHINAAGDVHPIISRGAIVFLYGNRPSLGVFIRKNATS